MTYGQFQVWFALLCLALAVAGLGAWVWQIARALRAHRRWIQGRFQ